MPGIRSSLQLFFVSTFMVSCSGSGGGSEVSEAPVGQSSVALLSLTPAPDSKGVLLDAVVKVVFSDAIAPASIHPASFLLFHGQNQIAGTVSYDPQLRQASFVSKNPFPSDVPLMAELTGGIVDLGGKPLASKSWTFRTVDQTIPKVLGMDPSDALHCVDPASPIAISFSETIDPQTLAPSNVPLEKFDPLAGAWNLIPTALEWLGDSIRVLPQVSLQSDGIYRVRVLSGLADFSGNSVPPAEATFYTQDTKGPEILPGSTVPLPDAVGVNVNDPVSFRFDEEVVTSGLNGDSIYLVSETNKKWKGQLNYNPSNSLVTLTFAKPLPGFAKLTPVVESSVHDFCDNSAKPVQGWSFSTQDAAVGTPELLEGSLGDSKEVQIAVNALGRAIAVWSQKFDFDGDGVEDSFGIFSSRSDASALLPVWSVPEIVNIPAGSYAAGGSDTLEVQNDADLPQIGIDAAGNGMIVFRQRAKLATATTAKYTVFVRRYDAATGWQGNFIFLAPDPSYDYQAPQVAMSSSGDAFFATGKQTGSGANVTGQIFGLRYDAAGAKFDPLTLLSTGNADQASGRVAADGFGNALLTWRQKIGTGKYDAMAIRFLAASTPPKWESDSGGVVLPKNLEQETTTDTTISPQPALHANGDGIVVWGQSSTSSVIAGRVLYATFDAGPQGTSGIWSGTPLELFPAGGQLFSMQSAPIGANEFLVVWAQSPDAVSFPPKVSNLYGASVTIGAPPPAAPTLLEFQEQAPTLLKLVPAPGGGAMALYQVVTDSNGDSVINIFDVASIFFRRYMPGVGWQLAGNAPFFESSNLATKGGAIGLDGAGNAIGVWLQAQVSETASSVWGINF